MGRASAGERLLLSWKEEGGPRSRRRHTKGFGSRVLERGLVHETGSTVHLDYRPDGLVCTMEIPLPKGARNG